MKKFFRIFFASSFLVFFFISCNKEQPTSVKNSSTDKIADVTLNVQNIIPVTPDKLFYQGGDTIKFSGKVTDSNGKGIPGVQVGIDDPVQLMCTLGPKTDNDGKFIYSVTIPSTAQGIYVFAFYCNTTKSYSAITVTPSNGLKLLNNKYTIPLGISSSISSFDIATSIKISSSSGFPLASQEQLKNAADQIGSFMIDAGRNSLVDFISDPATDFVSLAAIGCTAATIWSGAGVLACTPLYTFVEEAAEKSIIVGIVKAAIDKSSMSSSEKLSWNNAVDEGSCYMGIVGLDPASSAIGAIDAFGTGWTCGSAIASITPDSKSLKIIAAPSSASSKQNIGAFILLR